MRLDYAAVAPEATKALAGVNAALLRAGLDKRLRDLLFLRVSQINGCSYCVDEHARDLRQAVVCRRGCGKSIADGIARLDFKKGYVGLLRPVHRIKRERQNPRRHTSRRPAL